MYSEIPHLALSPGSSSSPEHVPECGKTDPSDKIILPPNLRLEENTVEVLIRHIYPGLSQLQPPFHQYFRVHDSFKLQ